MESWKKGRSELFDEFNKICNHISTNIAAEYNDEKIARISREELTLLRENSDRAEKLAEYNTKLVNELEKARQAAKRVEELERENQRLAQELQKGLQERRSSESPVLASNPGKANTPRCTTPVLTYKPLTTNNSKNTPQSSESPSSAIVTIDDDSAIVTRKAYRELIVKYNKYFEAYKNAKGAKEIVEERLKEEKKMTKDWSAYASNLDRANTKKYEKIKALKSQIQELKCLLSGKGRPAMMGTEEDDPPTPLLEGELPQSLKQSTDNESMRGKENTGRLERQRKAERIPKKREMVAGTDDESNDEHAIQKGVSKEVPKTIPAVSTPIPTTASTADVPTSLVLSSQRDETMGKTTPQFMDASRVTTALEVPGPEAGDKQGVGLPPHLDAEATRVQDMEYEHELAEQHYSSSTQDASDSLGNEEHLTDEDIPMNTPFSPESPIFTYARPVKKRKRDQGTSKTSRATRIKIEDLTSSPIGLKAMYFNESVDLDDIGEKVDTPRKQGRLQNQSHTSTTATNAILVHKTSISKSKPAQRKNSVLQPRSANRLIFPRTSDERATKKRRDVTDQAIKTLIEDGEIVARGKLAKEPAHLDSDYLGNLLSKPSPLKRVLSPVNLVSRNSPRSRPRRSLSASNLTSHVNLGIESDATTRIVLLPQGYLGINSHTRESPNLSPRLSGKNAPGSSDSSRPSSKGTLRSSVDTPRPSSKSSPRSSLEPSKGNPFGSIEVATPALSRWRAHQAQNDKSRSDPLPRQPSPISRTTAALRKGKPRSEMTATEWEMDPEQEPLRARPVETLTLRDFKINPNYNQGKNYAFQEVVRGNARACLQGCTKPECCGRKFRALAEGSRNPDKPQTKAEKEEEQELLEEFLGDNAYKIRNMNKDEREHTIIEAMTRNMANKAGRHRHAFERRASPPGFWNADFPTTQEEMQYRAQAKERERDLVLQRYQEAMRPSGAYLFRDE